MLLALDFLESAFLSGALPGGSWGSGSGPPGGPPHLLLPSGGPLSLAGRSGSLEFGGFLNLFIPTGFIPVGGGPTGFPTEDVTGSDDWGTRLSLIILSYFSRISRSAKISLSLTCNLAFILAIAICFFLLCVAGQLFEVRLHSLLFFLVFGVHGSIVPDHVVHGHICLFTHGPQFDCVFFLHEQHLLSQIVTDCVVCQIYFALVFCDLHVAYLFLSHHRPSRQAVFCNLQQP